MVANFGTIRSVEPYYVPGNKFSQILDKHFPKSHKFHKLFNCNNVKVSYSSLPNFASIINSHNKKILRQEIIPQRNHRIILTLQRTHLKIGYINTRALVNAKKKEQHRTFKLQIGQKKKANKRYHLSGT